MVRHFFSRSNFYGLAGFGFITRKCWAVFGLEFGLDQSQRVRLDGNTGARGMPDLQEPGTGTRNSGARKPADPVIPTVGTCWHAGK